MTGRKLIGQKILFPNASPLQSLCSSVRNSPSSTLKVGKWDGLPGGKAESRFTRSPLTMTNYSASPTCGLWEKSWQPASSTLVSEHPAGRSIGSVLADQLPWRRAEERASPEIHEEV